MSRFPKGNSLADILLNGLLGLLSCFVPKDRQLILLGSLRGQYFRGNPKYLYLHLGRHRGGYGSDEVQPLWITASPEVYRTLRLRELPVVRLRSLAGFWAILRANSLVISHSIEDVSYFQFLPGRFRKVHAYHGLPLKGHIPDLKKRSPRPLGYLLLKRERQSNDLFLTTSAHTATLERGFLYPPGSVLGYPRNDVFFQRERCFNNYRDTFSLDSFAKVILYCPTFRDYQDGGTPFSRADIEALNALLEKQNYLMLVSRHHLDSTLDLSNLTTPRVVDISGRFEDIQDLLPDIDLMISDYSSIVFDFMLSGRPIIYYCHDYEQYRDKRGFMIDYFEDLPGPFCHDAGELCDRLATIDEWSTAADYLARSERTTERFHTYRDGNSSARLAAVITHTD